MYSVGQKLIYEINGIFEVKEITSKESPVSLETQEYYHLKNLLTGGDAFVPVTSSVYLKPIPTAEKAREIIESIPQVQLTINEYIKPKNLQKICNQILDTHDFEKIIEIIKYFRKVKCDKAASGKSLSTIEERCFSLISGLFEAELAFSLDMDRVALSKHINEYFNKQ